MSKIKSRWTRWGVMVVGKGWKQVTILSPVAPDAARIGAHRCGWMVPYASRAHSREEALESNPDQRDTQTLPLDVASNVLAASGCDCGTGLASSRMLSQSRQIGVPA